MELHVASYINEKGDSLHIKRRGQMETKNHRKVVLGDLGAEQHNFRLRQCSEANKRKDLYR